MSDRRVGEVTLEPRDREFPGEVFEERIRNAEIPLRVLEIDRVHFVRHGGGAHFPVFRFLCDPSIRDVAPHVLREVEKYRVDAAEIVEHLGVRIVRLYLGRDLVQLELDELLLLSHACHAQ